MALTNAEKQAGYRERHLGVDGGKRRLTLFIDAPLPARNSNGWRIARVIQ